MQQSFPITGHPLLSEVILSYLGTKPNAASTVSIDDLSI